MLILQIKSVLSNNLSYSDNTRLVFIFGYFTNFYVANSFRIDFSLKESEHFVVSTLLRGAATAKIKSCDMIMPAVQLLLHQPRQFMG